ncbi:tetratricopeptide repeat protein [Nocardia asteroides]|uniref:tetratricopeptide repeat protein n=1 Tax=Nocardia asteroides TaxID=1824 RepID=UPI001E5309E1|nr:tetratricopeptide repeat protein [Nocardia asteroides]UGT62493.1 tetratricopeptide repeat protein [Nocardia asteroides]
MTPRERFGTELRHWRTRRGLSQEKLGRLVHRDKSVISRIESGQRPVDAEFVAACEQELDAGGALLEVASTVEESGPVGPIPLRELGLPPLSALVGRDDLAAEIRRMLLTAPDTPGTGRVCVLHGMAGVGKTALALSVAHTVRDRYPDGCVYRDLGADTAGLRPTSPGDLLEWLLRHLQVDPGSIPAELDERAALFHGRTRDRRILLVLDNVSALDQVRAAIPSASGCAVLIITRQRFPSLEAAAHIELPLLSEQAAHQLLDRLVPAEGHPEDRADVVAEILRSCGGLPLAVRVAAGMYRRKKHLGLAGVLHQLNAGRLVDGERDVLGLLRASLPERGTPERRLFVLTALFPGQHLTPRTGAALHGGTERETGELLDLLWDRHLLMPGPGLSYRMHDLLRQLATDELGELPQLDRDAALRRLIARYLADADSADRVIAPRRNRFPLPADSPRGTRFHHRRAALDWLHTAEPVLLALAEAALQRGFDEYCWHLAHVLRGYFFLACRIDSWTALHAVALTAARRDGDEWWEATTRGNLGLAYAMGRRIDDAEEQYRTALRIFTDHGDQVSAAHNLGHLAWIAHLRGDYSSAVEQASAALTVYQRAQLPRNAAIMMREIGTSLTAAGRFGEAEQRLEAAIVAFRALDLEQDLAMALHELATLELTAGEPAAAATLFAEAKELAADCGARGAQARALRGLGDAEARTGRYPEAAEHLRAALTLIEELALPGAQEIRHRLKAMPPATPVRS